MCPPSQTGPKDRRVLKGGVNRTFAGRPSPGPGPPQGLWRCGGEVRPARRAGQDPPPITRYKQGVPNPHPAIKEESRRPRQPGNTQPTLDELVTRLTHPDRAARLHAASTLGQMGRGARKAVPALAGALRDADAHVRRAAALALGDIGPDAAAAVPALLEALDDRHAAVRRRAAVALGEVGAAAAVRGLLKAVGDSDGGVREMATAALSRIEGAVRARAA